MGEAVEVNKFVSTSCESQVVTAPDFLSISEMSLWLHFDSRLFSLPIKRHLSILIKAIKLLSRLIGLAVGEAAG